MPIASFGPAAIAAATRGIEGAFADIFPAGNVSHHFVGQDQAKGVYAKELRIPAGVWLVSHAHAYDHLAVLASGTATLTVDDKEQTITGPCAVTIKAGEHHKLTAVTDAVWFCIHPTDETDADKVDDVILKSG